MRDPNCTLCGLHEGVNTVCLWGRGTQPPIDIMFVGEAPGEIEDIKGIPFIGKSGTYLRRNLAGVAETLEVGLTVGPGYPQPYKHKDLVEVSAYFSNVVKCRPPGNRDPKQPEIDACQHIFDEIVEVHPTLIVALGKIAAVSLISSKITSIKEIRNQVFWWQNYPILVTYHPQYMRQYGKRLLPYWIDDLKGAFNYVLQAKQN